MTTHSTMSIQERDPKTLFMMLEAAKMLGWRGLKSEVSLSWLINSKRENTRKRGLLSKLNPEKYKYIEIHHLCL